MRLAWRNSADAALHANPRPTISISRKTTLFCTELTSPTRQKTNKLGTNYKEAQTPTSNASVQFAFGTLWSLVLHPVRKLG